MIAAPFLKAEEVGEWSESVDGVEGRLIAKEDQVFNGTKIVNIYLELRNTSYISKPIHVYFDVDNLTGQIVDSANVPISKPMLAPMSVFSPMPLWLVLPFDGSTCFRVSVSGYGIPKRGGTAIQLMEGLLLVGPSVKQARFLEATFVSEPENQMSADKWRGTIRLPKVLIPR